MVKAIRIDRPGQVACVDMEEPVRGPGEVLAEVLAAGVCGSDISAWRGTSPLVSYPRVIGHEICARVLECDPDSGFSAGDRVLLEPYVNCGRCHPCRTGRTNCCENLRVLGVHIEGGMRQRVCHPARLTLHADPALTDVQLAMVEPLSIALHAVHRAAVASGEWVAVLGAGPIGNLAGQAVRAAGATPILVDIDEERLALARRMGMKHTVNPARQALAETILGYTGGDLADAVIEATGAPPMVRAALDAVRNTGRVALVGWPKNDVELPTRLMTLKELDVRGSRNSSGEFPGAMALIAGGQVDVTPLVSAVVSVCDAPGMLVRQAENPSRFMKGIVTF